MRWPQLPLLMICLHLYPTFYIVSLELEALTNMKSLIRLFDPKQVVWAQFILCILHSEWSEGSPGQIQSLSLIYPLREQLPPSICTCYAFKKNVLLTDFRMRIYDRLDDPEGAGRALQWRPTARWGILACAVFLDKERLWDCPLALWTRRLRKWGFCIHLMSLKVRSQRISIFSVSHVSISWSLLSS